MATRIRLARAGAKKRPFYRLVATDVRSPRDGRFIEKLGAYNPLLEDKDKNRFLFDKERVDHWLATGAIPTERVAILLYNSGYAKLKKYLPAKYFDPAPKKEEKKEEAVEDKAPKAEEAPSDDTVSEAKPEENKEPEKVEKKDNSAAENKESKKADSDNSAKEEAK